MFFCVFNGKKIAFEIQVSELPAKYIFYRLEFYKRNDIYLLWVLDDFDRDGRTQTERDIKYLTPHQNYFFFLNSSSRPGFIVQFKEGLVNSRNQCCYPWTHEKVSLHDLKFDQDEKQIYFRSLKDEQEAARSAQNRKEIAPALELFRQFYQSDDESYIDLIEEKTDQLGFERLQPLCEEIAPSRDSALFFKCLEGKGKPYFLMYLLRSHWFPKNLNCKNTTGINLFEALSLNPHMTFSTPLLSC